MKALTIIVVVLAALYSAVWVAARTGAERGALAVAEGLRAEGWDVAYDDLSVRGYPSRVDTTVTGLRLANGAAGWQAPFVQVFALAWRPTEVIAVWPPEQVVTLPGQELTIASDGLRASASIAASTALALDQVTVESGPLTVVSSTGWATGADRALAAFRQAGPGPADYDLFIEATTLALPDPLRVVLDPGGQRPAALALLRLDAMVTLAQPLDRFATGPAQVQALTLRQLALDWGDAGVTGAGSLTVGQDGTPEGRITLTLRNWRALIAVAVAAGVVSPEVAPTWENMGAALSGGGDTLDLPVTFADGNMSLGPLPLGPAPRLR
jgi:hypothetical protein